MIYCFLFVFDSNLLWRHLCGSYLCQTQVYMVCLQSFVISVSNSLVIMQVIEESNQMNYILVVLDSHDYFPSQMIWACHWHSTTLWSRSMTAFACGWFVVTCSLFGFNAIIVIHLFELMFEFATIPLVKEYKMRSRVTCQPGVIKQILDGCCWLICGLNIFEPTCGCCWIYHCECNQRVCFGWCPYCEWTHQVHTDHDSLIVCQILLFWVGAAHILTLLLCHLTYLISVT
jgi:hypothetical protein